MDLLTPEEPPQWLENTAIGVFRVWHIIFLGCGGFLGVIIMFCCCIRIRIPRTRQEIEADYQRRKIARKFRQKLAKIKNSEMDDMDLKRGMNTRKISYNLFKYNFSTRSCKARIH